MAALENRVRELEVMAGAPRNQVLWVSWKPSAPAHEITGASVGGHEWQREADESESDFQQRVNRATPYRLVWARYDEAYNFHR